MCIEQIKAMANRVVNMKYCDLSDAMESVCGTFSESTKELHSRVWDEVENILCCDSDPYSVADRI